MTWSQVIVLAVLQGLTEFLPVSSSGHLAIASRLFFADDAGASFTAVTQLGTEFAVLVYFARDIGRIVKAWVNGLFDRGAPQRRLPARLVRASSAPSRSGCSVCCSRTKSALAHAICG